jgi:rod shape-determining protein MreD
LGAGREMAPLWFIWTVLAPGLTLFGWLLASTFFLRWVDWWPILVGAVASVALFPVVLKGLLWIERGNLGLRARETYRGRA